MALIIDNGIVSDDENPWVDYVVLSDDLSTANRLYMDEGNLLHTEVDEPECNPYLTDISTGLKYFAAIDDDGYLVFRVFASDLKNPQGSGDNWVIV